MKVWRVVRRFLAVLGVTLFAVVVAFFAAVTVICRGPSSQARGLFVTTVMETSAAKFLARMYFSDEEIAAIRQQNAVIETDLVTDDTAFVPAAPTETEKPLVIEDVTGGSFKGKMMIVRDPKRLFVGTSAPYDGRAGKKLEELVKLHGAVGGINAGGFRDEKGFGNGGTPIVGKMSAAAALEKGIREAVSFGPVLVANGQAAPVAGTGGGLNPRTAIGQRADGAVLLLVIDGRQSHSLGAGYKDCQNVMLQYGAVNAANLDGGSSTLMIYENAPVNYCASLYGSREIPTSFLVR